MDSKITACVVRVVVVYIVHECANLYIETQDFRSLLSKMCQNKESTQCINSVAC